MKRNQKRHLQQQKKQAGSKPIPSALVDIVIPVHNCFDLLAECLEALPAAANGIAYRTIIIDNASDKEEADAFYKDKDVIVVRNKENRGFPATCNQGVRVGHSPLIFLLNSDVTLAPQALEKLVLAMDDPSVGVAGMKLLFSATTPNGPAGKVQHVGLYSNIRGDIEHLFIGWSPDHPKVLAVKDVLGVTGAAFMTRRTLYAQLGGLNEAYGAGNYEDVDFCMKTHIIAQKRVIVVQEAVGTHYVGATLAKYNLSRPLMQNKLLFQGMWGGQYPWTHADHA